MENLLFIGKFNIVMQNINSYLSKYFNIQLCPDMFDMVQGIMQMKKPKIVLISLIGVKTDEMQMIFHEFRYNYSDIPVVCIGSESEQALFFDYLKQDQFATLSRPLTNAQILEGIILKYKRTYGLANASDEEVILGKKKVLFVDENLIQLRTMKEVLKGYYDVEIATSAAKACICIGQKKPDIIFMGYDLPLCNGAVLFQMLKEIDGYKDIPVVFLTGVKDKETIETVLALNPAGYMLKPANKDKVMATIEKLVVRDEAQEAKN